MKKILFLFLFLTLSCENSNLENKKKKLDKLKNSLVETYSEIERLEKEIILLDSTFIKKNYELVSVSKLEKKSFINEIELRGNIESRKNVIVVPEVIGKYVNINVLEGQYVDKGTQLAKINSDIFDNNLNEIKSNLDLIKTIFERQSNLWEKNIGSEIDYLRAKSNYESIKSRYNATRLQKSKFEVVAPFSGVIDEVNVKVGEMASPSVPSFRILNDSEYFLSVDISEGYINSFSIGDSVKVISDYGNILNSNIISISKGIRRKASFDSIHLTRGESKIVKEGSVFHNFIQEIRDETHRYAISLQKRKSAKSSLGSSIDNLSGVGDSRKKLLLRYFGSLEQIKRASIDDLSEVSGIGRITASSIYKQLHD